MCDRNITKGIMYPGGQSLNIPANVCLQGAEGAFLGCMGNDEVMRHLLNTMDELGIDHRYCRFYPVPSHTAYYKIDGNERVFLNPTPVKPNPMSEVLYSMLAYEGFTDADWEYMQSFDMVHCSNDSRIEELFPEMKRRGIPISFDFSVYYEKPDYMEMVCPYAEVVLMSCSGKTEEEIRELTSKAHELGTSIVIATCGSNGSVCYDGKDYYRQPVTYRENVIDTMGAGDAFISAFLMKMIDLKKQGMKKKEYLPKAMGYAADYAADACMVEGSFGHGIAF